MALYKKLTAPWQLTDGVLPAMELEKPIGVYEAVRRAGYAPDAALGLNALACEWICARRWVYSTTIEAPDEGDDLIFVELPKVEGGGTAYLNGEYISSFESGAVRLELTGKMNEGDNRFEIRFAPAIHLRPENPAPVERLGIYAEPVLRTANFAAVERVCLSSVMDGDDGAICAEFTVDVRKAGKYTFRYGVMGGDEAAQQQEICETLSEGRQTVAHDVRVEKAIRLDTERMEDTVYSIKFSLERGGVGCDVRHMETAFRKTKEPARCFALHEWPVSEKTVERMLEMGADGVVLCGMPENAAEYGDYLDGLTVIRDGVRADAQGMISPEKLKEYAQNLPCWPADTALWRLRGGVLESEIPEGAENARFVKAMRLHQAMRVMQAAGDARREKRPVIVQLDEEFGYFVSRALIEKDGAERPALTLLKALWNADYVCCELPESGAAEPGAMLHLNVWAMTEGLSGSVLSAAVRVMDLSGREIASTAFPVMGGGVRMAGVMNLRTPGEDGLMVVRTELTDEAGEVVRTADSVLAVGGGMVMDALCAAPQAKLAERDGKTVNEGSAAAISAGLCLMPGEETDRADVEWFNA